MHHFFNKERYTASVWGCCVQWKISLFVEKKYEEIVNLSIPPPPTGSLKHAIQLSFILVLFLYYNTIYKYFELSLIFIFSVFFYILVCLSDLIIFFHVLIMLVFFMFQYKIFFPFFFIFCNFSTVTSTYFMLLPRQHFYIFQHF